MKKVFRLTSHLLLVSLCLFLLIGCQKFDVIKLSFLENGYQYSDEVISAVAAIIKELESDDIVVIPHTFIKDEIKIAIVLEFSTSKELKQELKNNETLKDLYASLSKSKYMRGNCLLIPSLGFDDEIVAAFNSKKVK